MPYPRLFAPQVVEARALPLGSDGMKAVIRVRQKHVITVVIDTSYDVKFEQLDTRHGYSTSRSTRIDEIDRPGTDHGRALAPAEDHGFLWRLNTYWTCQQRDGGLYLQIESVSLSRSIPTGLGWALRPYVTSVPRVPRIPPAFGNQCVAYPSALTLGHCAGKWIFRESLAWLRISLACLIQRLSRSGVVTHG